MALIDCPECGKRISEKAAFCVGCGFVFEANTKNESEELINDLMKRIVKKEIEMENMTKTHNRLLNDLNRDLNKVERERDLLEQKYENKCREVEKLEKKLNGK